MGLGAGNGMAFRIYGLPFHICYGFAAMLEVYGYPQLISGEYGADKSSIDIQGSDLSACGNHVAQMAKHIVEGGGNKAALHRAHRISKLF